MSASIYGTAGSLIVLFYGHISQPKYFYLEPGLTRYPGNMDRIHVRRQNRHQWEKSHLLTKDDSSNSELKHQILSHPEKINIF